MIWIQNLYLERNFCKIIIIVIFIIAKSNTDKVNCGSIVKELSMKCHGNGGGSKTFAQGGGSDAKDIATYLEEVKNNL